MNDGRFGGRGRGPAARPGAQIGLVVFFFASVTWGSGLKGILHDPPGTVHAGEAVPIELSLDGAEDPVPQVTVRYRIQGASTWESIELESGEQSRFRGEIPGAATRGLSLKYYIEIHHPTGAYHSRVGSEEHPVSVVVLEPRKPAESGWYSYAGLWIVGFGFVVAGLSYHSVRKRSRSVDRLFWVRTLEPMTRLSDAAAREQARKLAGTTLSHPVHGQRSYTLNEIMAKLREVRSLPREKQTQAGEGPGHPGDQPRDRQRRSAQVIGKGAGQLAADVRRLCAAAWFLSGDDSVDSKSTTGFMEPFEDASRDLRALQKAMARNELQSSSVLLDKLTRRCSGLGEIIVHADFQCSPETLVRRLSEVPSVTAEALGSLLEYYGFLAEQGEDTGKKLLAVAEAIARRDDPDGTGPRRVREVFRRRKLMRSPGPEEPLPAEIVRLAANLRRRIGDLQDSGQASLDPIAEGLEAFQRELGPRLYTLSGLAEALALKLTLDRKVFGINRVKAGSLDSLVTDLADLGLDVAEEEIEQAAEHEDVEAIELLRATEAELRAAVAANDIADRGFYLAPLELVAASNADPKDAAWASLVVRCATCRTAVDRFAQRHARTHQPDGQEPPPIPEATALTLESRARQLMRDLQDAIERDVMRGKHTRAKEATRLMHRLSRARSGLIVLAQLPDLSRAEG